MKALVVLLLIGCQREASDSKDPCERAVGRMSRLNPAMTGEQRLHVLDECHGRYRLRDPILVCALDAATDDAAVACMDKVAKTVVPPH